MSRSSLWVTSSFAQLLRPRSDFTSCRVERLPSRTCVFDLPRRKNSGFEAFPAVYRAPSLYWHRPGYEFPGVHGWALASKLATTHSQSHFRFHPRRDYRRLRKQVSEIYRTAAEDLSIMRMRQEQRFFGLPWPFCGARGLSPLRTSRFIRFICSLKTIRRRVGIPPGHRLTPQPFPLLPPTSCEAGVQGAQFSDSIWR